MLQAVWFLTMVFVNLVCREKMTTLVVVLISLLNLLSAYSVIIVSVCVCLFLHQIPEERG